MHAEVVMGEVMYLSAQGEKTERGGWAPTLRYPDPLVKSIDPRFDKYKLGNASVERLFTGARWGEGPAWFGGGRYFVWSDIPANIMRRWDETNGLVSVFRDPSNNSNGNTRDREGRLLTCEHLTRRVTRTEHDGTITVICDSFKGKRLNSPNDVIVKSDGSIWFSDPAFGILGNYEGDKAEPELPTNLYRVDGKSGAAAVVTGELNAPNGLAFSPGEKKLYIVETASHSRIHVFDVAADGAKISNGKVFIDAGSDAPDGIRVDVDGNLWCAWGTGEGLDGVRVYAPDGDLIGHIALPERCANICFGGVKRNRLFMVASHSLYALFVGTQGLAGG
jgi:gluconolactonase